MSERSERPIQHSALRLGTRASELARTQSGLVADLLSERTGREVVLVPVRTEGDVTAAPLASLGGTGVLTVLGAVRWAQSGQAKSGQIGTAAEQSVFS